MCIYIISKENQNGESWHQKDNSLDRVKQLVTGNSRVWTQAIECRVHIAMSWAELSLVCLAAPGSSYKCQYYLQVSLWGLAIGWGRGGGVDMNDPGHSTKGQVQTGACQTRLRVRSVPDCPLHKLVPGDSSKPVNHLPCSPGHIVTPAHNRLTNLPEFAPSSSAVRLSQMYKIRKRNRRQKRQVGTSCSFSLHHSSS